MRCWPARSPSGSPYCSMPRGTASRWLVYGSRSGLGDPERSDTSQRSCVHSAAHPPPAGHAIRAGSRETVGKSQKQSRRELIEKMQRDQARADRRRTILIVVLAIVVGLGIIAYPAIRLIQDARLKNTATADIGAKASAAACDAVLTDPAETYEQHETQEGIVIKYKYSPPTSGRPASTSRSRTGARRPTAPPRRRPRRPRSATASSAARSAAKPSRPSPTSTRPTTPPNPAQPDPKRHRNGPAQSPAGRFAWHGVDCSVPGCLAAPPRVVHGISSSWILIARTCSTNLAGSHTPCSRT